MNPVDFSPYRCPATREALVFEAQIPPALGGDGPSGLLRSRAGLEFPVVGGVPDFTHPKQLRGSDLRAKAEYDRHADEVYNNFLDWLFRFFYEDEDAFRGRMIDLLNLRDDSRVLEISCGTGRDTVRIAHRLKANGVVYTQDLSGRMVLKCKELVGQTPLDAGAAVKFFVGNAAFLPFPDRVFDAVYHFGGINEFAEKQRAFEEMSRVVRVGGKVVVGDESMAPWLRDKEYGKMLINNNKVWANDLPLALLPENSRKVCLRWVLGNAFYLIDYEVGEGLPEVNLDLPHQGKRGGTCRTRYFGQLEGVTPEAKRLAQQAVDSLGVSMHEWLDRVVREQAESVIGSVKTGRP